MKSPDLPGPSPGRGTQWAIYSVLAGLAVIFLTAGFFFTTLVKFEEAENLAENDALARGLAEFIEARERGLRDVLLSYAGRFRLREAVKRKDRAQALTHLRELAATVPEIDRPFLTDPAGVLWAAYPEAPTIYGQSLAHREWYRGVSRDWQPYWSEVIRGAETGALGVVLAVPIRDHDGRVIGIIASFRKLDVIAYGLLPLKIRGGDLYVVDRKGQFIFHRTRTGLEHLSDYARVPVVERLLRGEEGVVQFENPVEGEIRLTAYRRLPSVGWGIVVYRAKNLALQRTRTLIWVSGGAGLLLVAALGVLGAVAIRNQRQTERVNAQLQEEMAERRRAQEATLQAREEAERASQAKSEFLSRMSHELRTPLNSILGFAQVLEMDRLTPEQQESVGYILKAGHHLLALIDEILDIARIEAGRLRLSLEPVPVKQLLDEARSLIRPLAAERNVRLEVHAPVVPNLYVLADRQRLNQVLLNLLSNAVKYNRDGGSVTLSCEETAGSRLRFSVTDTGPGIPPEKLGQLFTPFERLGVEPAVEGTGLGLALSKGLVEAMGGTVGVESTVGQGSTFWVELARAENPEAANARAVEALPVSPVAGVGATVLYIEDNLSNLKLIEHVLGRRPGIKLLSAMQGRLGLDLAREHRPGLILLDLNLPDLPGDEVLRRLQADPRTREIPVVVISADASTSRKQHMLVAGARDYLTKPIDVKALLRILDETLEGGRE